MTGGDDVPSTGGQPGAAGSPGAELMPPDMPDVPDEPELLDDEGDGGVPPMDDPDPQVVQASRGISIAEWDGSQAQHCSDLELLQAKWYYNWSTDSGCDTSAEYVPQVWGDWNELSWVASPAELAERGERLVLGFNEPDHSDQANLTVQQVIQLWPEFDQAGFELVGSPAAASDGQAWFEDFMSQVEAEQLRVDFIAIHWYGWESGSCDDVNLLEQYIEWAEQWDLPIWLTEWSCRVQSAEVNQAFFTDAVAMFAQHPLVERYAWYLPRSSGDFAGGALVSGAGELTPFGEVYVGAD